MKQKILTYITFLKHPFTEKLFKKLSKQDWSLWILIFLGTLFSTYIMFISFSFHDGELWVHYKSWSDFLSHIPLIRSFSYGNNWPPEYPLFTGEPIRYHFGFYLLVGMLEKLGLRLDLALNLLSIIGLTGLIIGIYLLAIYLTGKKKVGWIAVILMLFNSSWSWLYYFGNMGGTGLKLSTINDFFSNQRFAAFGPYNNTVVSAFWTLNIFTNQRHLAFSMGLVLLISYLVLYKQGTKTLLISIILIGLMTWLHKAMLLIIFVLLGLGFLWQPQIRKRIFITILLGVIAITPGVLSLNGSPSETMGDINLYWGYLYKATTWQDFPTITTPLKRWLWYWLVNLGLTPFLAFTGYWLLIRQNFKLKQQHLWFSLAIVLFIIINSLSFAIDIGTNHKFANFMVYILNIYTAYVIASLWESSFSKKILSIILIISLILGGLLDFYPLINDYSGALVNIKKDPTAQWITTQTPPQAKFLSLTYNNSPVTITGRRLFLGFDYFPWSIGYATQFRRNQLNSIVQGSITRDELCTFLKEHQLSYIYLDSQTDKFIDLTVNKDYFLKNYPTVYHRQNNYIFSQQDICTI